MADKLVETNIYTVLQMGPVLWGPYWSDESTAIILFCDEDSDLSYARTTNKGATWTTTKI